MQVAGISVEVLRKPIKNLYLRVGSAADGQAQVRLSAPLQADDRAIHKLISQRLGWITQQQARLQARPLCRPNQWLSGEQHPFQGELYQLELVERPGSATVSPSGQQLRLGIRPNSTISQREAALNGWYRSQLQKRLPGLFAHWQPIIGEQVAEWRIKRMKTRWGSCNPVARRIWLSLELIKKPAECLEYVLVHEMVHLLERGHNARFYGLMDRYLPTWRSSRERLNGALLNGPSDG